MRLWLCIVALALVADAARAEDKGIQVTIYNGGFATVKERRTLTLKTGENELRVSGMTSQLEPDSVILRGLRGENLRILEQNYEANPLSQAAMLRAAEGKTIDFEIPLAGGATRLAKGKIIRASPEGGDAIVELEGKIRFGLPGKPLFDALDPNAILEPTLLWRLQSDLSGAQPVEISYLTRGFTWESTYNVLATGADNLYDIIGWVTLSNTSGKDFPDARLKLIAGDVARADRGMQNDGYMAKAMMMRESAAAVSEKSFDEYHLYTLPRPTTLHDRETKQVEFLRASRVQGKRLYVVESAVSPPPQNYTGRSTGEAADKIPVNSVLEILNGEKNHLGMPLPAGTMKVYRADDDGHNELVGEARIDHTPAEEKIRLALGTAFDLVAERRMTSAVSHPPVADATFEIKLRNHKKEDATFTVVEHLSQFGEWSITGKSHPFEKADASTIRFNVTVPAKGESVLTYTVHYTW